LPLIPPTDTLAGQTHVSPNPKQAGDPSHRDPQPRSFDRPSGYTVPNQRPLHHLPSHHRFSSRHISRHHRSGRCNTPCRRPRNLDSAIQPKRLLGLDRRPISECLQRQRPEMASQLSHPPVCRLQATTQAAMVFGRCLVGALGAYFREKDCGAALFTE
jgi:hypothetical protein